MEKKRVLNGKSMVEGGAINKKWGDIKIGRRGGAITSCCSLPTLTHLFQFAVK